MVRLVSAALFLSVVLLSAGTLFPASLHGQPTIEMTEEIVSVKRVALVIGNSAYQSARLKNPVNDAQLMVKTLESTGFEVIPVLDANRSGMLKAIRDFGNKLNEYGRDTVGLFYFAGHGIQSGGVNYLIPVGANIQNESDLEIEAVTSQSLLGKMQYARNATNIIILDACRNNPYHRSFRSAVPGLAKNSAPEGSLVAFSTAPGRVAADGRGDNSPYALALVKQMLIPGQGLLDVFANAAKAVARQTDREQIPWNENSLLSNDSFHFKGTVTIDGMLAPGDDEAPAGQVKTQQSEITFWESVKDSADIADIQAYLDKHPNGYFAALAKNKIARLEKTPRRTNKPGAGSVSAPVIDKDTIFWQAMQNSKDPADYQAYLESYPGGGFVILAKKRLASLRRAEIEQRAKADRRNELMESERENPEKFWKTVTPQDAALLVSDARSGNWPVFALGDKDYDKDISRLHLAALANNEQAMRLLLERGADVNARIKVQQTPLHVAAFWGHDEVVRLLLEQGADIKARDKWQYTPLHRAAGKGQGEVARVLLAKGADIEARQENQATPLHLAAEEGHDEIARLLLEQGANIRARDKWQFTPLHWAAQNGQGEVARVLLEQGADANARNKNQATPLHVAAWQGHDEVARVLLEQGADANARNKNQATPLHVAAWQGHDEVARVLLKQGADIEARQENQATPLHWAAQNGQDEVARLLLEKGADIEARQENQATPLHIAAEKGQDEVARLLLEQGANIKARDKWQFTPLHWAAQNGQDEVARLLLEQGAETDARDKWQFTPLHRAAEKGQDEVARVLLKQGADINARDEDQWTPLHLAAFKGHDEVARLLLEQGANIEVHTNKGKTALGIAKQQGHTKLVELLQAKLRQAQRK